MSTAASEAIRLIEQVLMDIHTHVDFQASKRKLEQAIRLIETTK